MRDPGVMTLRDWYRHFNWDAAYVNRLASLKKWIDLSDRRPIPRAMIDMNCRMLFQACRRGRYRAVWSLLIDTLQEDWHMRGFARRWEWIRTRILRRPPDPDTEDADRFIEETKALDEMAGEIE